jgi:hypothetical protein
MSGFRPFASPPFCGSPAQPRKQRELLQLLDVCKRRVMRASTKRFSFVFQQAWRGHHWLLVHDGKPIRISRPLVAISDTLHLQEQGTEEQKCAGKDRQSQDSVQDSPCLEDIGHRQVDLDGIQGRSR